MLERALSRTGTRPRFSGFSNSIALFMRRMRRLPLLFNRRFTNGTAIVSFLVFGHTSVQPRRGRQFHFRGRLRLRCCCCCLCLFLTEWLLARLFWTRFRGRQTGSLLDRVEVPVERTLDGLPLDNLGGRGLNLRGPASSRGCRISCLFVIVVVRRNLS